MSMRKEWVATCDELMCPASYREPGSVSKFDFGMALNDNGWASAPFTNLTYCDDHYDMLPDPPEISEAEKDKAARKFAAAIAEADARQARRG